MPAKTSVPKVITELVKRFDLHRQAYLSGQYNETQLRQEFINPFFEALGWDVNNKQGYAEAYKDVIHEDAIKVGGFIKAPDYCFRIGGARKFFLEAKKPSVNIKEDVSPAFQLRRYAFSAKLPLSILTDFEEFAVYYCRQKPDKTDKASAARLLYLTYQDYPSHWEKISSIFSREAVLKGSFDKYIEASKVKKGAAEVDAAFLKEIESWREMLARNIALRNTQLSQRELNFSVQRIIDRIIFLRICEDRGIEDYGRLMGLLNGSGVYERLLVFFKYADQRYNSGLFHFQEEKGRQEPPDKLTPNLTVDDKPLKEIIKNLYYPDSPYEFSVLPADILGQVYEQFLGKVIRLTAGHRAVVEDKPEVKKAGGVYYTPTYIVDYIVKNTVGKIVGAGRAVAPDNVGADPCVCPKKKTGASRHGGTPLQTTKQISKLRILDPACGSGSFLIGAYQYLLDWHRDWYINNDPQKWAKGKSPALYQAPGGEWRLTIPKRKEILLNNIYGVDIDPQAVEVTKLSLLLKVLEGETQPSFFRERALPDLGSNIKCGNSLIGPDFYKNRQINLLDEEEHYRINAFDWEAEFPKIMKAGGFDAVIGNPPYSAKQSLETKALTVFFNCVEYKCDPYALFIEQGLRKLRRGGLLGYIVPVTWMTNYYYKKLRQLMIQSQSLSKIILIDGLVFKKANVDTCLLFLAKEDVYSEKFEWSRTKADNFYVQTVFRSYKSIELEERYDISPEADNQWLRIKAKADIISIRLDTLGKISLGMKLRSNKEFVSDEKNKNHPDPIYFGDDVYRYGILSPTRFFNFNTATIVGGTKNPEIQNAKPKIFIQAIRNLSLKRRIVATLDEHGAQFVGTLNAFTLQDKSYNINYILGLLNSTFLNIYFRKRFTTISLTAAFLGILPIYKINFSDPADKARHDHIVKLVEHMLALHKQSAAAKTDHEQTAVKRQIDTTDRQIDKLVYELYGLTEEEIKTVEGK